MKKMKEYRERMSLEERKRDHYRDFEYKKDQNDLEYFPISIVEKTFNDGKIRKL
jgi:hypothetical protein